MFKDAKQIANKIVDATTGPLNTFDQTVSENPDLIMPLAALHASIVALSIAGAVAVIRGHQEVRIAKEQTKQIRMKAMLEFHGKHHPRCRHGHHGKPGMHHHNPRMLAQHDDGE
ncbi:hypothetical protein [Lacticaseibacillus manihotivorans]|uniref:Uncharacterized protein n=2 Tax=Lacticaseibacillus manihotivorans TaxID=88233 RepID=A0A0R1QFF2_9LACO|nr:hypothetical protein [Lacticaseibacillus manihotivorans]KRL43337.1 hypothetical protein FD01_GL001740 [Lacticaseibacillus manihotivorans DSM 13343 = JCM 12514]QFQ92411.1 hypothetical protein LM010_13740 [Lacticaseibacillus manihotivorans]